MQLSVSGLGDVALFWVTLYAVDAGIKLSRFVPIGLSVYWYICSNTFHIRKPSLIAATMPQVDCSQMEWSPTNPNLLAGAHQGDIKLWDLRNTSTSVASTTAHMSRLLILPSCVNQLYWSPTIQLLTKYD